MELLVLGEKGPALLLCVVRFLPMPAIVSLQFVLLCGPAQWLLGPLLARHMPRRWHRGRGRKVRSGFQHLPRAVPHFLQVALVPRIRLLRLAMAVCGVAMPSSRRFGPSVCLGLRDLRRPDLGCWGRHDRNEASMLRCTTRRGFARLHQREAAPLTPVPGRKAVPEPREDLHIAAGRAFLLWGGGVPLVLGVIRGVGFHLQLHRRHLGGP
mmetsp:Transcript_33880/g.81213  ORF Transcript_33880/g.81213 Transcript_33880/m.81213 type:complete len:210 (-) Transcript_33880:972-1601(-)